ncbi:MAG: hypothetical protein RL204_221 [Bacteroidota bacterium]|jgi:hypothetical protein
MYPNYVINDFANNKKAPNGIEITLRGSIFLIIEVISFYPIPRQSYHNL